MRDMKANDPGAKDSQFDWDENEPEVEPVFESYDEEEDYLSISDDWAYNQELDFED